MTKKKKKESKKNVKKTKKTPAQDLSNTHATEIWKYPYLETCKLYTLRQLLLLNEKNNHEPFNVSLYAFINLFDPSTEDIYSDLLCFHVEPMHTAWELAVEKKRMFAYVYSVLKFVYKLHTEKYIISNFIKNIFEKGMPAPLPPNQYAEDNKILLGALLESDAEYFNIDIKVNTKKLSVFFNRFSEEAFTKLNKPTAKFCNKTTGEEFLSDVLRKEYEIYDKEIPLSVGNLVKHKKEFFSNAVGDTDGIFHPKEGYFPWYVKPRIPFIETLLLMEKKGAIKIQEMSFDEIIVEISDISKITSKQIRDKSTKMSNVNTGEEKQSKKQQITASVKRKYIYNPDLIEIKWEGGIFSPQGGKGKIFQAIFQERIICKNGEYSTQLRTFSTDELRETAGYKEQKKRPNQQVEKVISEFKKLFKEKELPLQIKCKYGRYYLEENQDNTYDLVELPHASKNM